MKRIGLILLVLGLFACSVKEKTSPQIIVGTERGVELQPASWSDLRHFADDDLMQIIRFKYFKGSSTIAQLVTFTPPIVAIIISVIVSHHIYAINVGTIFALLCQGPIVGIADKIVFPSLKHRNLD